MVAWWCAGGGRHNRKGPGRCALFNSCLRSSRAAIAPPPGQLLATRRAGKQSFQHAQPGGFLHRLIIHESRSMGPAASATEVDCVGEVWQVGRRGHAAIGAAMLPAASPSKVKNGSAKGCGNTNTFSLRGVGHKRDGVGPSEM